MTPFFNFHALRSFIEDAATHYSKSAPALCDWLDEIYIALAEKPESVSVYEIMQVERLRVVDGDFVGWEQPNYAQNRFYKLRVSQGKDAGVLSY